MSWTIENEIVFGDLVKHVSYNKLCVMAFIGKLCFGATIIPKYLNLSISSFTAGTAIRRSARRLVLSTERNVSMIGFKQTTTSL